MKRQVTNYTYAPGGAGVGTLTLSDYTTIALHSILMVVNTTRQEIIFNFADTAKGGTVATNVLTLEMDTSTHASGDKLYVVYDDVDPDFDSGAGTALRQVNGIIVPASGGPVTVPGDAANGLDVDVTRVQGDVAVTLALPTSGGATRFDLISAASDNATSIKGSAGHLYGIAVFNTNASARYLKFHNTAGTPTQGSGVDLTFLIPGSNTGAGVVATWPFGIAFATGIGITTCTGITEADTGDVASGDLAINIFYK